MPAIAVQPIILNDVTLTVGTDSYEAHVSQVQMDPTSQTVRWRGMTPTSVHSFGTTAEWAATLTYAQDWETTNSLSNYLYDHEGETIPVTFAPKAGGTAWDASLIIAPGSIGGTGDTVATATVTLGIDGRPTRAE